MIKSNKKYEDKCWGHNCERYELVDNLRIEVKKIYEETTHSSQKFIWLFVFYLDNLALVHCTLFIFLREGR